MNQDLAGLAGDGFPFGALDGELRIARRRLIPVKLPGSFFQ